MILREKQCRMSRAISSPRFEPLDAVVKEYLTTADCRRYRTTPLLAIYDERELDEAATCKEYLQVR